MRKIDSRDVSDRDLELLLTRALGGEARPGAAARRAAWQRVATARTTGAREAAPSDRVLGLFAAGMGVVVAAAAAALSLDLVAGLFADVVTALVVLNLAAVPVAGLAIVLSRRHRYAEV